MNKEEMEKALEIIKQPIQVNCIEYKYFDQENYNKLVNAYENCLWFIRNIEQINVTMTNIQNENTNLKQALNEIRKYANGAYEMATYTKSVSLDEENIEDILQIIDKVLGDEK